jgi:serine/threonine-protein kinase
MGDSDTEQKQRASARVGSVLHKKWRLDALLGLGGMAAVYAATHRNGKLAAIKVLHPEAALIADVKARFLREGYLANKVGHAGAVSILDDDVDVDGTVFLVMELLEGETLDARWTRDETLPWQQVFVIADKVLDVLIAAHKKEIVHRDLKPGNVFLCADGAVKILDFGIARLQTITQSIRDTGGHNSLGTPGF